MKNSSVLLVALALAAAIPASKAAAADRPPNVIVMMADDMGYETVGANGGTSYQTPVLDRLAAEGVRFSRCYVQPLCTPTRMQLMTGAYNVRNYVEFGVMDPSLKTFGNLFKDAGYATCIVGKWQLGQDASLPRTFGFDESCLWQHTRIPPRYGNPGIEINGVEKDFNNGEYGPDIVNDYARDFIERNKDRPFFLYYPMILPHEPFQPTPDSKEWDPKAHLARNDSKVAHFADMVAYVDKMVGKIIAKLDELQLRENTLFIFLCDNGTGGAVRSMMGDVEIAGGKGQTNERGMRVPLIVSWPTVAARGAVCDDLIASTDILPTICEAARVQIPPEMPIDGQSFLPQIRGEKGNPRKWIYSWYSPRRNPVKEFAFNARYKLYATGEFYDLSIDVEEQNPIPVVNLTGESAAAASMLQDAINEYRDARPASLGPPKQEPPRNRARNRRRARAEASAPAN